MPRFMLGAIVAVIFSVLTFTDLDLRDGRDIPFDPPPPVALSPVPVYRAPAPTTSSTTSSVPTRPARLVLPPENSRCVQYHATAVAAGLDADMMARWDLIMWRESRCRADAHNASDPNGGSHGLVQINGYWCRPSRWSANGWLQDRGILASCDDLYDPWINLLAAAAIFEHSAADGCGWRPWTTRDTRWCS